MTIYKQKLILQNQKQYVDIWSTEIDDHKRRGKDIRVVIKDEYMDIPRKDFKRGKHFTTEVFNMQYAPFGTYTLISFEWENPQKIEPLKVWQEIEDYKT